jgi:Sulfotransferase family
VSGPELARRVGRKSAALRSRWASRHFVTLGKADPELIFIAGTARSGTTWLAELLARNSRRRIVFEPFRNDRVPLWERAATWQYIRPDDAENEFLEPARRILNGDFRNEWADYYNERLVTRGRIIKDIRANLMLPWLYEQFGPFPLIYLIRHPAAVAASWMREGWTFSLVNELLSQPQLVEDVLTPVADLIRREEDPWGQIIYLWCIENFVPLRQFSEGEILIVFYENLITQPETELMRIGQHCGIQLTTQIEWLSKPSATTNRDVSYASQAERLSAGRTAPTSERAKRIMAITARFELEGLYADDGAPNQRFVPAAWTGVPTITS